MLHKRILITAGPMLLFVLAAVGRAQEIVETTLEIVNSKRKGSPISGTASDFTFCRDDSGPFILYVLDNLVWRFDYETEHSTRTSVHDVRLDNVIAVSPDCRRIFLAIVDPHNNDTLVINEWNGETEERVEEFSLSSDESGIQGFGSVANGLVDIEFNPVNGHLFLLAHTFAPFDGEPAIVEFDWEAKEIVNTMALLEPATVDEFFPGVAFEIQPETDEFFLELLSVKGGPHGQIQQRRVGRFSADGVLTEIFLLPELPTNLFPSYGRGFVLAPATDHPIVYANSSFPEGAGFFELAPAAPAAGKGWERYE